MCVCYIDHNTWSNVVIFAVQLVTVCCEIETDTSFVYTYVYKLLLSL